MPRGRPKSYRMGGRVRKMKSGGRVRPRRPRRRR
jgi:hypothetical protein